MNRESPCAINAASGRHEMIRCCSLLKILGLVLVACLAPSRVQGNGTVQFNRDVRPILSENCFPCHGPDPGSRKAGMRFDQEEGLFGPREYGTPVVRGKSQDSLLYQRITTDDEIDLMPPPESRKKLTPEQIELVRRWIVEGAPWEPHWSLIPPKRTEPPPVRQKRWVRNPIDQFILARLEARNLEPAPEADRRTLARRAALDLTGLPPSPEQVEAFVKDKSPAAYPNYLNRLMESPQWGEHRARYWLDAARYADTHGMHFDNYREMWPYRDWVIAAFNRNQPFDQFTIEQLAGDLLPNPTREQRVATGFQRCNPTTNEGGTIEEENLANYANDRVTTLSWVWLGMTANCASCHDHKFDPIPTRDFYAMSAFFRNTTQGAMDGNIKDTAPSIVVPQTASDARRWDALPGEIVTAKQRIEDRREAALPEFDAWKAIARPEEIDKDLELPDQLVHVPLNDGTGEQVIAFLPDQKLIEATGPIEWISDGKLGPAPIIQSNASFILGDVGDFERTNAFSYGAWVKLPDNESGRGIIARMDNANQHRGWDLYWQDDEFAAHIVHAWPENVIKVSTKGKAAKKGEWQHVFVTYDGSSKADGIRILINGVPAETNTDNDSLTESIRTGEPLRIGQRSNGNIFEGGSVQDVRIYSRQLNVTEVRRLFAGGPAQMVLAMKPEQRSEEQLAVLFDFWLETRDGQFQERNAELVALEHEQTEIRNRNPVSHVQAEKSDSQPMAHILLRGQYNLKGDEVKADTFSALPPMPAGAPRNRLGLAQWLMEPSNPLTARVTVNRFWQEVFGTGLVRTPEDFGIMGELPSHPELLDWLAVEFIESGWDVKHLFTLMLTSATYRQDSTVTEQKLELDPGNRLLSRGPRFRMDAEMVRDYALATSELLVHKIGGPSVKPYQPPGVWEAVAMKQSDTSKYERDSGDALYRRSLYTFWKRAAPPASMDILNAPSRETCTVKRERTNTPLQALLTLNDPQFLEAARHLAEVALRGSDGNRRGAVEEMFQRLTLRPMSFEEANVVFDSLVAFETYYAAVPKAASELLEIGESEPDPSLPPTQLAAMTMLANQLLNLDEVLNK